MIKAFLSHSSKDKSNYVRKVADQLGKDHIEYDELTFEEGEKSFDELIKGLNKSNIFVIFLSNNSLESEWVKKEIVEAKIRFHDGIINKIFPIIIDDKLTYRDSRIPEWLRENYNLKPIMRPTVAAKRIHTKLRELSWSLHPELKRRNTIFVGRNDKLEKFEERIHDFDREKPTSIVVSGFTGVGRRTFLHHALCKTNITESSKKPSPILLDMNVSIEDFILKLNDLGFVDLVDDVISLSDKSVTQKISIIHKIMDASYEFRELIYIVDDGCLVNHERAFSDWFLKVVDTYHRSGHTIFCIAAKYKVNINNRPKNDKHHILELSELNPNERRRLLTQLLDLFEVHLNKNEFDDVAELLSGFPDQVMFAVDLIKNDNTGRFIDKLPLIAEYNTNKASVLLGKYESDGKILDFIRLLAQFEVISSDFIFQIVPENEYYPLLEELASEHVVELIGIDGEIIRLNDIVRDFIKRNRLKLNTVFLKAIGIQVENIIDSDDVFERDSSEFIFSLKEALKSNKKLDDRMLRMLIPSHYLRCMKDLYYNKGSLDRIIELADLILQKKSTLEKGVLRDIRYYLCLALAKKKDERLLKEVQNINGDEHTFLLGYYYRKCGRLREALDKFISIIDGKYVGARAKREIVQVYVQLEEYEKAIVYAKNNYEENRGNQFHTQAYFNCLINSDNSDEKKGELEQLISNLRSIDSEQSNEMAGIAEAIYIAKVENNETLAIDKITDCANMRPDDYYPLLAMCDIAIKYRNKDILSSGLSKLESQQSGKMNLSSRTLNRYRAYLLAFDGKLNEALKVIESDLSRYPVDSKARIMERIREISELSAG